MHAPSDGACPSCFSATSAWQLALAHDRAAFAGAGSCGAWQLVQSACSVTRLAPSVGLRPWQAEHVAPLAVNPCG
jgi:hypothetical protein